LLGTNDSQPQNWEHKETLAKDLSSLIDTFATITGHRQTWVCLPLPAFGTKFEINDSIIQNEILPVLDSVARARGVPLIDCNTPFQDHSNYYTSDGIHLNSNGLAFLAGVIYNAMKSQAGMAERYPHTDDRHMERLFQERPMGFFDVTGKRIMPGSARDGVYLMYDRKNNLLIKMMVIKQE
jgi:hypothetical protein